MNSAVSDATGYYSKYKDDQPIHTINRIRNILSDLGILTVEHWVNSISGIYSVRVNIVDTGVGTNGKGTTPAYALASAYGEFIERLQNHILYWEIFLSPTALNHGGFKLALDEKYLSLQEVANSNNELLKNVIPEGITSQDSSNRLAQKISEWFPSEANRSNRADLVQKWSQAIPNGWTDTFVGIPFYQVSDGSLCYVPYQILRFSYGSNGMSAGNTPEEALVQGIAEIFERHVIKEIITKKITPPTVPLDYLQKFPSLLALIQELERTSDCRVIVKDCSLGQGFPVIAVMLIDQAKQSYFVKFGAHPAFSIALERCLTEILQGRDLSQRLSWMMRSFTFSDQQVNHPANMANIIRIGTGSYPNEFFSQRNSYLFQEFPGVQGLTNQELLHQLINLIQEKGYSLLVRDVSYLGFPSFHVLIPGMSEILDVDTSYLETLGILFRSYHGLHNLAQASDQELKRIITYLIRRMPYALEADNLVSLLGFHVTAFFPWNKIPNFMFIGQALYKLGKIQEAYGMMRQLVQAIQELDQAEQDKAQLSYYKCIRDYLKARTEMVNIDEIKGILQLFYPSELVIRVVTEWGNPDEVLKNFGRLNCWNCAECDFRPYCSQELISNIHMKLKEQEAQNPIDQRHLKNLFDV